MNNYELDLTKYNNLKNCPLCNGKASIEKKYIPEDDCTTFTAVAIVCTSCLLELTTDYHNEDEYGDVIGESEIIELVEKWNRRV